MASILWTTPTVPFSEMNSIPTASKTVRTASRVAVCARTGPSRLSILWMVARCRPARSARSSADQFNSERAARTWDDVITLFTRMLQFGAVLFSNNLK